MSLEQEIKTHTRRVESGELVRYRETCPRCAATDPIRLHDRRRRTFRLVIDGCVRLLASWICRWTCQGCGARFSDYPPSPCRINVS